MPERSSCSAWQGLACAAAGGIERKVRQPSGARVRPRWEPAARRGIGAEAPGATSGATVEVEGAAADSAATCRACRAPPACRSRSRRPVGAWRLKRPSSDCGVVGRHAATTSSSASATAPARRLRARRRTARRQRARCRSNPWSARRNAAPAPRLPGGRLQAAPSAVAPMAASRRRRRGDNKASMLRLPSWIAAARPRARPTRSGLRRW